MSEPTVSDVPAIIEHDASERTAAVAAAAAAQIDQAQKDAEAIARAAQQTDLGGRIQSMHEENQSWRATLEQRLADQKAEAAAQAEALKASILEAISTRQSQQVVVPVPEPESASVEHASNSPPTDTTKEKTSSNPSEPHRRLRRVL
jgi:folylpolyglutamate synthase/dihydropteroate synthase